MNQKHHTESDSLPLFVAQRVDAVCNGYELAWQAGKRPHLENYLDGQLERAALLRELIALDLELCRGAGEVPQCREYARRFPEVASWINSLFEQQECATS